MTKEEAIARIKDHKIVHKMNEPRAILISEALDMAIKALEQEPCEDAISRQAMLETIDSRIEQIKRDANKINKSYSHLSFAEGVHDGYCRLKCDLRILPSVNPQKSKWIPVSERMPNNEDYVLVCYENGHIRTAYYYFDTNFYPSEFEDCCETGWYNYNEDFMYEQDVIAWMPLPKHFEPQERSDKE